MDNNNNTAPVQLVERNQNIGNVTAPTSGNLTNSIYAPASVNTDNTDSANAAPVQSQHQGESGHDSKNSEKVDWMINNSHYYLPMAARLEVKTDEMMGYCQLLIQTTTRLESSMLKETQLHTKETQLANTEALLVAREVELVTREAKLSQREAELVKEEAERELKSTEASNRARQDLAQSCVSKLSTMLQETRTMSPKIDAMCTASEEATGTVLSLREEVKELLEARGNAETGMITCTGTREDVTQLNALLRLSIELQERVGDSIDSLAVSDGEQCLQAAKLQNIVRALEQAVCGMCDVTKEGAERHHAMLTKLAEGEVTVRESINELKVSDGEQRLEAAKLQDLVGQLLAERHAESGDVQHSMVAERVLGHEEGGMSAYTATQKDATQLNATLARLVEGQVTVRESIDALRASNDEQRLDSANLQGIVNQLNLGDAIREGSVLENNSLNIIIVGCIVSTQVISAYRGSWPLFWLVGFVVLIFSNINMTAKCNHRPYRDTAANRWKGGTLGLVLLIILVAPLALQWGIYDIHTEAVANNEYVVVMPNIKADNMLHVNGCNGTIDQLEHFESPTPAENVIAILRAFHADQRRTDTH
ncbi:hypothetical protein DFP73DRAFT_593125 [Morchella snyderi]|nr:hypothetical protein DFP73DRAFT_593125 [Morchella snyderi]